MAHVRVKRFGAGDREHDGAEREERGGRVRHHERDRVCRTHRRQHARLCDHMRDAERRERREPHAHDGSEEHAHARGAAALNREQRNDDHDGDRIDERVQVRGDDVETFDGAEHRDGRRDHAVAVEHGCAEDADADEPPASPRLRFEHPRYERGEREDAAFAAVVGAHDQRHVLQRHHDHQRPEDDRQDAHDVRGGEVEVMHAGEALPQRVQRTGADVAVDHADGADDQRRHARRGNARLSRGGGTVGLHE